MLIAYAKEKNGIFYIYETGIINNIRVNRQFKGYDGKVLFFYDVESTNNFLNSRNEII